MSFILSFIIAYIIVRCLGFFDVEAAYQFIGWVEVGLVGMVLYLMSWIVRLSGEKRCIHNVT